MPYIELTNTKKFHAAIGAFHRRGAAEACWVLVAGRPGLGKTSCVARWGIQTGACTLRLETSCTPAWVLRDLVLALGGVPRHTAALMTDQARELLAQRPRPIILDEAEEGLKDRARVLDTVRALSDRYEIPVVLAGREQLVKKMQNYQQLLGRVAPEAIAVFEPATLADVAALRLAVTGLQATSEADAIIRERTGGVHREIMHALAELARRFGRRAEPLTAAEVGGLVVNRAGGVAARAA